jgi:hypothetical protein
MAFKMRARKVGVKIVMKERSLRHWRLPARASLQALRMTRMSDFSATTE